MDITGSTNGTSPIYDQAVTKEVGAEALQKALETQAANAAALINALPQPEKTSANLPDHLGQNVNTTA